MLQHKYTSKQLKEFQALPLERKINLSKTRLIEWYQLHNNKCFVAFSGGKDSTVVADLTAQVCKVLDCKLTLWFSDTGLEFPEIKQHVKSFAEWLRGKYDIEVDLIIDFPKDKNGKRITFTKVIEQYGYPLITKQVAEYVYRVQRNGFINHKTGQKSRAAQAFDNELLLDNGNKSRFNMPKWKYLLDADFKISNKCCDVMKRKPAEKYMQSSGQYQILGTMAEESMNRTREWLHNGCNITGSSTPSSRPISFWTNQDVLAYIATNAIPTASVYGEIIFDEKSKKLKTTGEERTGCVWCGFGAYHESRPNRFERLKITHPQIYDYCMRPTDRGGAEPRSCSHIC